MNTGPSLQFKVLSTLVGMIVGFAFVRSVLIPAGLPLATSLLLTLVVAMAFGAVSILVWTMWHSRQ